MTEQEFRDLAFMEDVARNTVRIEAAQKLLEQVTHIDLNTQLKDAIHFLEKARQTNHSMYCSASNRVYK